MNKIYLKKKKTFFHTFRSRIYTFHNVLQVLRTLPIQLQQFKTLHANVKKDVLVKELNFACTSAQFQPRSMSDRIWYGTVWYGVVWYGMVERNVSNSYVRYTSTQLDKRELSWTNEQLGSTNQQLTFFSFFFFCVLGTLNARQTSNFNTRHTGKLKHEGLSTSIKYPNETISLVEKSTRFLFYADVF